MAEIACLEAERRYTGQSRRTRGYSRLLVNKLPLDVQVDRLAYKVIVRALLVVSGSGEHQRLRTIIIVIVVIGTLPDVREGTTVSLVSPKCS